MQIQSSKVYFLILGGTNFIGKTLLKYLSIEYPHAQVILINRGKIYWNNEARIDHPNYIHYIGDRKYHNDFTRLITYINNKLGINNNNKWKAVVDFSAFKWRDVQSVVKPLSGKTQKYLLISSQSIYNSTKQQLSIPVCQDQFNLQEYYRLEKVATKKKDKYGYNKMKCQIYLQKTKYVPYISLRLPDVIGPYDNTQRFWCTLKWIENNSKFPIPLNQQDQKLQLNFVYSIDVCKFIIKLINSQSILSSAYNLRFQQTPTLKQFLNKIAHNFWKIKQINKSELNFIKTDQKNSNNFYPSTNFGLISIDKSIKQFNWSPSPLDDAISTTINFFLQADKYKEQKKDVQRQFKDKVIDGK